MAETPGQFSKRSSTASPVDVQPTTLGTAFGTSALAVGLSGLLLLSGPLFSVGLLAWLLHRLSRRLALRHLSGVSVHRALPRRALAGQSFPVETRLTPGLGFPDGATISFLDPLANAQHEREITPSSNYPAFLRYTGKSMRRGYSTPRNWSIRSTWPLGFFATERRGAFEDSHPLLVLPNPVLPAGLRAHLNQLAFESDERSLAMPDPSAEFRLLREFRNGDPVRGIHWPASLRTGQLQIAELEPPRPKPGTYGILLHSFAPPGRVLTPETFEQILRIATGLASRFKKDEIPLTFRHYPAPARTMASASAFREQFDRLALCRRSPLSSLDPIKAAAAEFESCDKVFILSDCPLTDWEPEIRASFPRSLCIDVSTFTEATRRALRTSRKRPSE